MAGSIRKLFTSEQIVTAMVANGGNSELAASSLSDIEGVPISRQALNYWLKTIDYTPPEKVGPKILLFDIETAPLKAWIWSIFQKFIPLQMLSEEWFCLSYSAKWLGDPADKTMYKDLRGVVDKQDDTIVLREIHALLCEADVVITQNGNSFDVKKLNARFLLQGFSKPTPYKKIDTLLIAKKEFGFTSNKLEWMTDNINVKYKKLKHGKFPGFELWDECLKDNPKAWDEMEEYNKHDVLSLEELYMNIRGWDSKHPNLALFNEDEAVQCNVCSSTDLVKNGFARTNLSLFQQYKCNGCGKPDLRGRVNLLSKDKRKSLMMNVGQ